MKKSLIIISIIISIFLLWSWDDQKNSPEAFNSTFLPSDVLDTCSIVQDTLDSWFASGSYSPNGVVKPANSIVFPSKNNRSFYQWSEQMFFWLTSPLYPGSAPGSLKAQQRVFQSVLFYDVSPEDTNLQRTLIPHDDITMHGDSGHIFTMTNHVVKNGPHRLPVVKTTSGQFAEVERHVLTPGKSVIIRNADGTTLRISAIGKNTDGTHTLFSTSEKKLSPEFALPKLTTPLPVHNFPVLQEIVSGKDHVFLFNGKEVDVEATQATGNVLMGQVNGDTLNGPVVYYLTMVNNVYAWYLTAVKNKAMSGNGLFPTTGTQLDSILSFVKASGAGPLPSSEALAMELKSSWVELSSLPVAEQGNYITTWARIPVYIKVSNKLWYPRPDTFRTVKMALTGMHVVGSARNHPEMIWATFEQKSNAPNAEFDYLNTARQYRKYQDTRRTNWLFSNSLSMNDNQYNEAHMLVTEVDSSLPFYKMLYSDTIRAVDSNANAISASNTLRSMSWGAAIADTVNQQDITSAMSNSEILSLNYSLRNLLSPSDIRRNYLFLGAIWTFGGQAPDGTLFHRMSDTLHGAAIGTSRLANSTIETYIQYPSNTCFTCHIGSRDTVLANGDTLNLGASLSPDSLSHIFTILKPFSGSPAHTMKK